eukprot:scaffold94144_cov28-Tisochrysis_lutea.AAC.1
MYERSYMHRQPLSHILCTSSQFVVTASSDGIIKFWRKAQTGIEFVKTFRAHVGAIRGLAATSDGSLLASSGADNGLKVFDVLSFDMIAWMKLDFTPGPCEWVGGGAKGGEHSLSSLRTLLAVADADSADVRLLDAAAGEAKPLHVARVHSAPVRCLKFWPAHGAVVSADSRGLIEYWSVEPPFGLPKSAAFQYKTDTDLYALAKARAAPTFLSLAPDGEHFALGGTDGKIRIFRFRTGKTRRT